MNASAQVKTPKADEKDEFLHVQQILDAFSEAVVAIDTKHKIILLNQAASSLLNKKIEDILGKKMDAIVDLAYKTGKRIDFKQICFQPVKRKKEIDDAILNTYGNRHWVNVKWQEIETKPRICFITLTDITQQKELQKTKDEFVSVASHELRTPMTIIKSYLWLISTGRHGKLTKKQKDYITKAILSTERMIALINDILNISKIEQSRADFNINRVELVELLSELLIDFRLKAMEKALTLNFKSDKDRVFVYVDTPKLREILVNLVGNALKFTEEGSVEISVTDLKGYVKISVKDTGQGIKESDLKRLFLKFGRLDSTYQTVAESGGTGLGLFIVRVYVEEMNGKVGAESPGKNKGSTFWFTLPKTKHQLKTEV